MMQFNDKETMKCWLKKERHLKRSWMRYKNTVLVWLMLYNIMNTLNKFKKTQNENKKKLI